MLFKLSKASKVGLGGCPTFNVESEKEKEKKKRESLTGRLWKERSIFGEGRGERHS